MPGITGATAWFILEYHSVDELWQLAKTFKEKLLTIWTSITVKFSVLKYSIQIKLEERTPWIVSTYRKIRGGFAIPISHMRLTILAAVAKVVSLFAWLSGLGARAKLIAGWAARKLKTVPHPISRHNSASQAIVGGVDEEGNSQSAVSDLEKGNGQSSVEEGGDDKRAPLLSFNSAVKSAVLMKRWRSTVARKTSVQESPINGLISAFKTIQPTYIEDIAQPVECMSFSPDGKFLAICK